MKKKMTVLFLICLFCLSGLVYAKPDCDEMGNGPKPNKEMMKKMHQKHLNRLAKDLKLTDDQKAKIDQILKSGWDEMEAKKEKFKQEMKELREQKDVKIKELLNDEQKANFEKICKKMDENMKCKFEKGKHRKEFKKGMKDDGFKDKDDKCKDKEMDM